MGDNQSPSRRLFLLGDARQVHLRRWAEHFLASGYDVLTVSLESDETFPGRFRHVAVTKLLPHALRYPLCVPVVRRIVERFDPHLINAHFVPNYGLIASMLGRRPWVLSTWGSDIMTDPDKSRFHYLRTRRVLRNADWVTSDADVMTRRIHSFGVAASSVLTFPYGVDTAMFHPRSAPLKGPLRIVSNRKHDPVYDVTTLIDAFAGVIEAIPGTTLTVAGDGPLRRQLMERARQSIGGGAITFIGNVDHGRMPVLLRESHIYVSTALSDTTSVSLLEAMACGLFPIVTDLPANREWIVDGENGCLVPPGQPAKLATAIAEAWRSPVLIGDAIAHNLTLVASRAQWRDNMQPVRELFDSLCDNAPSSHDPTVAAPNS